MVNFVSFNHLTHINRLNTVLNFLTIAVFQAATIFFGPASPKATLAAPKAPVDFFADGGTSGWTGDIAALDGGTSGWIGDIAALDGGTSGWTGDIA